MSEWEYLKLDLNSVSPRGDDIRLLNRAGSEGWELVSVTQQGIAFLKRAISEPAKPRNRSAKPSG
jgi:hypothetical protein